MSYFGHRRRRYGPVPGSSGGSVSESEFWSNQTNYAFGYDADKAYTDGSGLILAAANGDLIARMTDQSSNGFNLLQTTSGNRPTLQIVGGNKRIKFLNTASKTLVSANLFDSGYDHSFTLYFVKEFHGASGPRVFFGGNSTQFFFADDNHDGIIQNDWYTNGNGSRFFANDSGGNEVAICIRYDGINKRIETYAITGAGDVKTSATVFNLSMSGGVTLGDLSQGAGFAWDGFFCCMHGYKAVHDTTTITANLTKLRTTKLTEPTAVNGHNASGTGYNNLHDGDSLTIGQSVDPSVSYPSQLDGMLPSSFVFQNFGVGGQTVGNMNADGETEIDAAFDPTKIDNFLWAWGGTNDTYYGVSAEITYSRYRAYCKRRRAKGFKVIAFTALPRTQSGAVSGQEARRLAFNTLIRDHWTEFADALVDVAANASLSDQTNTTYYQGDEIHLTAAGYTVVAGLCYTALLTLWTAPNFPSPVAYYKFNDSLTPTIGSITPTGSVSYGAGKFANALVPTTNLVTNAVPILSGRMIGPYAVSFWTKRPTSGTDTTVFDQTDAFGTSQFKVRFFFNVPTPSVILTVGNQSSGNEGSNIPGDGLPHHICITVVAGVVTRYTDGVGTVEGMDASSERGTFDIDGQVNLIASTVGLMDDLAVWVGTIPTPAQIAQIAAVPGDLSTLLA